MWVRSQDKLKLINCDNFEIRQGKISDDEYSITTNVWKINNFAEYDSLEKCFIVLSEIQSLINKSKTFSVSGNITSIYNKYDFIYEFPKNDEV